MLMTRSEYDRMVEIADGWAKAARDIADELVDVKAELNAANAELRRVRRLSDQRYQRAARAIELAVQMNAEIKGRLYVIEQPGDTRSPFGTFWAGPYAEVV